MELRRTLSLPMIAKEFIGHVRECAYHFDHDFLVSNGLFHYSVGSLVIRTRYE